MKKLLISLVAVIGLSGCLSEHVNHLPQGHGALFKAYAKQSKQATYQDYATSIKSLSKARNSIYDICIAEKTMYMEESIMPEKRVKVTDIFKQAHGQSLRDYCSSGNNHVTNDGVSTVDAETNEVVEYLPFDMYSELLNAVKTCERARYKVMEITEGGLRITMDQYNEITPIIVNCKMFEVERSVNAKGGAQ